MVITLVSRSFSQQCPLLSLRLHSLGPARAMLVGDIHQGSASGPLQVECQETAEDLFVVEVMGPSVGVEDGLVELAVSQLQPGRAAVVEIGQGALPELFF